MRLINTETTTLETFNHGYNVPEYAIFSYTWAEDESEVSLREFEARANYEKAGWEKIDKCCQKARDDGWQYVWIDSCCIDKTSSAELSEAINSMYRYYEKSTICYAHLADVNEGPYLIQELRNSRWFRRGWTLQEMLAPPQVIFLDQSFTEIGTRSSLKTLISSITGVNLRKNYRQASVAQKFSWAAHRETTREEDHAYSLLGIFGIELPLIYGEGKKAFRRLQEEIVRTSSDQSIFAWTNCYKDITQAGESDIPRIPALAPHIECFKDCRYVSYCEKWQGTDLAGIENNKMPDGPFEFSVTKNAIKIRTLLYYRDYPSGRKFCALLNCRKGQSKKGSERAEQEMSIQGCEKRMVIYLEQKEGIYFRSHCDAVMEVEFPIFHAECGSLKDWHRAGLQEVTIFNEFDQQIVSRLSLSDSIREEYLITIMLSRDLEQQFLSASWATFFTSNHEEGMQIRYDLPNDPRAPREFKITDGEYAPMWVRVKRNQEVRSRHVLAVGVKSGSVFVSLRRSSKDGLDSFSYEDEKEGMMPDMIDFYARSYGRAMIRAELYPTPSRAPRRKAYVLHITYSHDSQPEDIQREACDLKNGYQHWHKGREWLT